MNAALALPDCFGLALRRWQPRWLAGMSKRNKRKRKVRKNVMQQTTPEKITPTQQTVANLEDDPLRLMVIAGMVDSKGEEAANEIMQVYLAICRDALAKGGLGDGTARGRYEISDELAQAHTDHYLPWVRSHPARVVNSTLRLVVERERLNRPEVAQAVAAALQDYARLMVGSKKKLLTDSARSTKAVFKQPELRPQRFGFFHGRNDAEPQAAV